MKRTAASVITQAKDLSFMSAPPFCELHVIVHLVFSNLKAWLQGTHHGRVEPQHLQAYLNEFTFRFNRRFYPFNAFRSLLGIGTNGEGPTYDGLYSGEWKHPTMASHHD